MINKFSGYWGATYIRGLRVIDFKITIVSIIPWFLGPFITTGPCSCENTQERLPQSTRGLRGLRQGGQLDALLGSSQPHTALWRRPLISSHDGELRENIYIDGSAQERCNSSALAMELCLSCTNPSTWFGKMYMIWENMHDDDGIMAWKSWPFVRGISWWVHIKTSWHGNAFRITGPFKRNPPVTGGFPTQGPVIWLEIFFVAKPEEAVEQTVRVVGDLKSHDAHIDGLVQERRNSSAFAMEFRLSWTNPSICHCNGFGG